MNGSSPLQLVSVFGLPILLILVIVGFSAALPETYPTMLNLRAVISDKSIVALLALAATIPMATNNWDLSVGFGVAFTHVVAFGLQVDHGFPWWLAVLAAVALGAAHGAINGLLVTRAKIHSFIATLGSGTVALGLAQWYTDGKQIVGSVDPAFYVIAKMWHGIPLPALYVLALMALLWVVFEYLPIGRNLYVIGSNPKTAELVGISTTRHVVLAYVGSGALVGFAGVVLASRLHVAQSSVGVDFMLPAFTAAMLGATTIRPGRVNAPGTVIAVLLLAATVAGLQQLGARFYVEALFNGAMLLLAVGLAHYATRRREAAVARAGRRQPPKSAEAKVERSA
ncbi:MAG: ABC transporter permease [Parvibaculaceae bacterium]